MTTFTEELLRAGSVVEFLYPDHNFQHVRRPKLERRRLRVHRVRSLDREPLDPITWEFEPDRIRGTTLVTGLDLDKGQERSFYAESMREVRECEHLPLGQHEVILIDEEDGSTPEPIYAATCGDEAVAFAREWLREPLGFTVGIRRVG